MLGQGKFTEAASRRRSTQALDTEVSEIFNLQKHIQARTAMLSIGRSTLRSQGAPGMVEIARTFLLTLNLAQFDVSTKIEFERVLERKTKLLMKRFPEPARQNWGAARKSLNIFLRGAVYNRILSRHYRLSKIERWLEIPLDRHVYDGLKVDAKLECFPAWPGVKSLNPKTSAEFQDIASAVASRLGTRRIHLDAKYWRKGAMAKIRV